MDVYGPLSSVCIWLNFVSPVFVWDRLLNKNSKFLSWNLQFLCFEMGGGGGRTLRTTFHTMNLCLPNSFVELDAQSLENRKGLREFNSLRALPVYCIFEDEKSKGQSKIWSSKKSHKKDHRTNIIVTNTNFVWEQLIDLKDFSCKLAILDWLLWGDKLLNWIWNILSGTYLWMKAPKWTMIRVESKAGIAKCLEGRRNLCKRPFRPYWQFFKFSKKLNSD